MNNFLSSENSIKNSFKKTQNKFLDMKTQINAVQMLAGIQVGTVQHPN